MEAHGERGMPKGGCDLWKGPTLEQFARNCRPWKDPRGEVPAELSPVGGTPRWGGGGV